MQKIVHICCFYNYMYLGKEVVKIWKSNLDIMAILSLSQIKEISLLNRQYTNQTFSWLCL